ncbi:EamA family transporter [Comamonas thiooxydans]|uniref:EamA family transporter n=1 Tax=Comamonas thiooxydans TaxID=363952 RepID=UPI00050F1F87|nr:EamA family transporter [Comamonas thiooxydans]KGG84168.1 multidrug transporter [Comamonas thiooxydans]
MSARQAVRTPGQTRAWDLLLTGLAPAIWGSSYIVTTQLLPQVPAMTVALLRALPAGLLLLAFARRLPQGMWWLRVFILGALNFSVFWSMLFVSAYRLPGGAAATVGAVQPLVVVFLAAWVLGSALRPASVLAALAGLAGVALLVLTPGVALDATGIAAGLAAALSMACGTVLTRKWRPPVPLLTFTAWQLTAGGVLLLPVALWAGPDFPAPTPGHLIGLAWLGLVGAALTYVLWFRGITRLEPNMVAPLGFLSPLTAILLGWVFLGQTLTSVQMAGVALVLGGIWLGQKGAAR